MKKYFFLLASFALIASAAQAQMPDKFILIGGSANGFRGELNEYFNRFGPGVHATLQLNRKHRLNGTFNLQLGSLPMQTNAQQIELPEGSAANPSTFVRTSFVALHYDLHLNLLKTDNWILYVSQGAGLMRFNPQDSAGNNLDNNTTTRGSGETFSPMSLLFPTSLGAQYIFDGGFGLGLQAGFLNPTTKYLDNMEDLARTKRSDNVLQYRFSLAIPLEFNNATPPRFE